MINSCKAEVLWVGRKQEAIAIGTKYFVYIYEILLYRLLVLCAVMVLMLSRTQILMSLR